MPFSSSKRRRIIALTVSVSLGASACTIGGGDEATNQTRTGQNSSSEDATGLDETGFGPPPTGESLDFGPAPVVRSDTSSTDPEVARLMDELRSSFSLGLSAVTTGFTPEQLDQLVEIGDPRVLWILADLLRFPLEGRVAGPEIVAAFEQLGDVGLDVTNPWKSATDRLIAWDLPAPVGYLDTKRALFTTLEPKWEPLFADDAVIDWRHVSWGGVLIDDRPVGSTEACERGCIPALDDPATTDATGGDWYPDDRLVFGIEIDGEARAYPKNIMEVHEMTNDTLGGRRVAIPYCTLCGSAQAYLTDELPSNGPLGGELPVLRTSGLLIRSNKMMYELGTTSFVDTFLGVATSGPLLDGAVTFDQVTVVTAPWGEWKAAHPDTTIVAEDGGIGRSYPLDPLRGRDDDGPIFPIGDVDPRLPVQEPVLGIELADGSPVAVHVASAKSRLDAGRTIEFDGVRIVGDGGGLRAVDENGDDLGSHQSFWFAWSQFRPETSVWPNDFSS